MAKSNANQESAPVLTVEPNVSLTGYSISKESFARDYRILSGNQTAKVIASSVSQELPLTDRNGEQVVGKDDRDLMKHIINLKAIATTRTVENTLENVKFFEGSIVKKTEEYLVINSKKAIKAMFQGRDEVDLGELAPYTLSFNAIVPASGNIKLPFKGQEIVVQTQMYESSKYEGASTLGITNMDVPPVAKAAAFSFDEIEEEEEELLED